MKEKGRIAEQIKFNITEDTRHPPAHEIVLDYLEVHAGGEGPLFNTGRDYPAFNEKMGEIQRALYDCMGFGLIAVYPESYSSPLISLSNCREEGKIKFNFVATDRVFVIGEWVKGHGIKNIKKRSYSGSCAMSDCNPDKIKDLHINLQTQKREIKECEEAGIPLDALEFIQVNTEEIDRLKCYCGCDMEKNFNKRGKRGWLCPDCNNFSAFRVTEVPRVSFTMETGFFKND